ncbi:Uncharacterized protein OnM2_019016 [Erysiphe neolycopersici]|uniref:Ribophorin II C-terminal domain-containing protein n=1 Tax=Erysiphe neolycopersici TaxID=212602 RepID=A0A420I3V1_9PEZI|nr:Uncharacterized protein OnM2_019016 [Erysiphe neolycopersici]
MRSLRSIFVSVFVVSIFSLVTATSSWNFDEAIISVTANERSASKAFKDKLSDHVPLANPVILTTVDTLKITLTAVEDGFAKRPHQAFLLLRDQDTGLEVAFPFTMMVNGKGKVEFTQKNFPIQLNVSSQPLRATLLLASFGSSRAFSNHVFNLDVKLDSQAITATNSRYEKPLRYGKREEIHHIFKPDPRSGPIIISVIFAIAVTGSLLVLFSSWIYLEANLSHLPRAVRAAPIAHTLFYGSILAMEFILFLYYYNWTLFQVLPVTGIISLITILSGSKALSEVQSRRLAGER